MKKPGHPGANLREDVLAALGISVSVSAESLGVSRVTLSRVINEHARNSPNLAVRLESAGVGAARGWLAMQTAHDLAGERAAGLPNHVGERHEGDPADSCLRAVGRLPTIPGAPCVLLGLQRTPSQQTSNRRFRPPPRRTRSGRQAVT